MSKFNYSIVKSLHYFFFQLQKVTVKINYYSIYKESTIFLIRLEYKKLFHGRTTNSPSKKQTVAFCGRSEVR